MSLGLADQVWMFRAFRLASGRVGRTGLNPAVGCVIVDSRQIDGDLCGWGVTGDGGRPHAEEVALGMAGSAAVGATVYVTLEPCSRRSSAGSSCSALLVAAGVGRVVIAGRDRHEQGRGLPVLLAAGLEVSGLGDDEVSRWWSCRSRELDKRGEQNMFGNSGGVSGKRTVFTADSSDQV